MLLIWWRAKIRPWSNLEHVAFMKVCGTSDKFMCVMWSIIISIYRPPVCGYASSLWKIHMAIAMTQHRHTAGRNRCTCSYSNRIRDVYVQHLTWRTRLPVKLTSTLTPIMNFILQGAILDVYMQVQHFTENCLLLLCFRNLKDGRQHWSRESRGRLKGKTIF